MRLQEAIWRRLKSILGMSKENLNVRYTPAVLEGVKELIRQGKYGSLADFMNRAATELLHREQMHELIQKWVQEEVKRQLK